MYHILKVSNFIKGFGVFFSKGVGLLTGCSGNGSVNSLSE